MLEQSYQAFELIVVDDGSDDDTREMLTQFGDRVRHIYQENQGPSAARNRGIRAATGEFLTFLDSDDLWTRDKLKHQLEFMQANPEAGVCYTDETWIRRGVRVNPRRKHQKHSGWIFEKCLPLCIVSPSSVLMRRVFFEKIGLFAEALPACEDYDLWLRASLLYPFHFIPEQLIVKRGGHDDQLSAQWGLDRYRVQSLLKLLDNPDLPVKYRHTVAQTIIEKTRVLLIGFGKRGKTEEVDYFQKIQSQVLSEFGEAARREQGNPS